MKDLFIVIVLMMVVISIIAGCTIFDNTESHDSNIKPSNDSEDMNNGGSLNIDNKSPDDVLPSGDIVVPSDELDEKDEASHVNEIFENMSLEGKIGQLFYICFRKDAADNDITQVDKRIEETLKEYSPGGIILFSENIKNIDQTVTFIQNLRKNSDIPLFIGVDEEGGLVSRLNASKDMHATPLPGNKTIGNTKNKEFAYKVGKVIGEELSSLGFNMDFAPVADILTSSENTVIGSRSFGSDPILVGEMVEMMVKGLHESNIATVIKHFPGHGDTKLDSHTGEVIVSHDINRLRQQELIPFQFGIRAGTDGVMSAHIKLPNLNNDNLPASLSKGINTDILRNELEYKNLIITDALDMGAITRYWSPGEAAVMAIKAGVDMLLMPTSLEDAYSAVLEAVESGEISIERIDESVKRILTIKAERHILQNECLTADPNKTLGKREHLDIVESIMESITQ